MVSAADELNAAFAEAQDVIEENVFPDWYKVQRQGPVIRDERGGRTRQEVIVQSGRCLLIPGATQGVEQAGMAEFTTSSGYQALMPNDTVVEPEDTLIINGREFEVTAVRRGGNWSVMTNVDLEERKS